MKKKIAVIFVCLFMSALAWAGDKKESNISIGLSTDKIQANIDDISALKTKVEKLELIAEQRYKHYDEILETQRYAYEINASFLIALSLLLIGLNGIFSFIGIRKEVKRRINTASDGLNQRFNTLIRETVESLKKENEAKLMNIEQKRENKSKFLSAQIDNALGRLYQEKAEGEEVSRGLYYMLSAIWYGRELEKSIDLDSEIHIRQSMGLFRDMLEKSTRITDVDFISDFNRIISLIDENKFRQEKEALKEILQRRLTEAGQLE